MSTSTPPIENGLLRRAYDLQDDLVGWRRHLHQHPELSGQEAATSAYVADNLRALGLEPRIGVADTYGVVADIAGGEGPAVALRADMDALPITEENDLPYRSRNEGVMHACGHDAHTAMLLGAARLLVERRDELRQPVRLIFQPAEELYPGGAQPMIAGGALDGVGRIFGLHIWSQLPSGRVGYRVGPAMASPSYFEIEVVGRGGHAAAPQECVDPILVGSHVVTALQSIVSRSLALDEQAVVSVTQFHAGTADNVIPPQATLIGTIRTYDDSVTMRIFDRVREICAGLANSWRAEIKPVLRRGYPALVNHAGEVERGLAAGKALGMSTEQLEVMPPQGGGEDFAYFLQRVPGAFFFLGAGKREKETTFAHHHPRFNIDEDVLPLGSALLAQYCLCS